MKKANIETIKVEVINYFDVWGNAKDGFEVNNMCSEGEWDIEEPRTNKDVLQFLKRIGFLKNHVRMNMINFIDAYCDHWEIEDKKGRPICSVRPIYR